MKKVALVSSIMLIFVLKSVPAMADNRPAVQKAYEMAIKAAYMLEQLGDEGLAAFNEPNGEFAWDGNYVFVMDCDKGIIAGHPSPKVVGLDSSIVKCKKTDRLILKESCQNILSATGQKNGIWMEYWWPKPGSDTPQRKVSFMLQVPNSPYQVGSGIYDDKMSVEELNKSLK